MKWTPLIPLYPKREGARALYDSEVLAAAGQPGIYEIGFLVPGFRTHFHQDTKNGYPDWFRAIYVGLDKSLPNRLNDHASGRGNKYVSMFIKKYPAIVGIKDKYVHLQTGLVATCLPLTSVEEAAKVESERIQFGRNQLWYEWNSRYEWKPIRSQFIQQLEVHGTQDNIKRQLTVNEDRIRNTPRMTHIRGFYEIEKHLIQLGLYPEEISIN